MEERECHSDKSWNADEFPLKQCNYLQGNYLRCVAEVCLFRKCYWHQTNCVLCLKTIHFRSIVLTMLVCLQVGSFEHNLTTDLLNQLVFLQKVFMKEVNEVIQKVSGNQYISFWDEIT